RGSEGDLSFNKRQNCTEASTRLGIPLLFALYAHLGFLAQYGRALFRRDHPKAYPPWRFQERHRSQEGYHGIPGKSQCGPKALHLDRIRGSNPRKGCEGETSVRVRTLAA